MKVLLILLMFSLSIYANDHDKRYARHRYHPIVKYKDHHFVCKQDHIIIIHKRKHNKEIIVEPEVIQFTPVIQSNTYVPLFPSLLLLPPRQLNVNIEVKK